MFSSPVGYAYRTSPIGSLKPILESKHTKNTLQQPLQLQKKF